MVSLFKIRYCISQPRHTLVRERKKEQKKKKRVEEEEGCRELDHFLSLFCLCKSHCWARQSDITAVQDGSMCLIMYTQALYMCSLQYANETISADLHLQCVFVSSSCSVPVKCCSVKWDEATKREELVLFAQTKLRKQCIMKTNRSCRLYNIKMKHAVSV